MSQHHDADYRHSISGCSTGSGTPSSYDNCELKGEITRSNSVDSSRSGGSSWSNEAGLATRKSTSPRGRKGSIAKELSLNPNRRHRRRFSEDKKKETHQTRLTGACLRCWRNRKRCIKTDHGCCRYCNTVVDPTPTTPFFRSRISSSELFRKGPTDPFCWTRRRWLQTPFNDTKVWRSPQLRLVVTQGMGLQLELTVKQYQPLPEDQDTYTWVDSRTGHAGALTMPRYAVADIGGAQGAINRYVEDHMQDYIQKKIGCEDLIPWSTFQMAVKLSQTEGSPLLRNALRLWTASRIIEDPWEIDGQETLGMAPCMDPGSPYYGKVPVTPVMDFQIDNITIHKILLPLRKEVLQELQKKVLENKRKDFLEIFLTMYILLHNIELTIAHDRWFAQRWNVKTRFSNYDLIDNVVFGANIMLTYFHHATKGYAAFTQVDWKKTALEKQRDDPSYKFMDTVSTAAKQQESSLRILRETAQYDSPMFWCSQLFYGDWKPVSAPCAA
ncbi:hypothetical protein BZA77DRAFT_245061 [Pyronema omphalodes]|nr:hypothetical protein BZA77DRAFT_245061 [Pyronema omphalodes]